MWWRRPWRYGTKSCITKMLVYETIMSKNAMSLVYTMIVIFVLGYLMIAMEHKVNDSKSSVALVLCSCFGHSERIFF